VFRLNPYLLAFTGVICYCPVINKRLVIETGFLIYCERSLNMYDHILIALDGSESSRYAGQAAMGFAGATGARVTACHVYGAEIHRQRFIDMEPGLPGKYRKKEKLTNLRSAHNRLMQEGFSVLSVGYLEEFTQSCRDAGIAVESVTTEGRSYVGILEIAKTHRCDLIVLGADGLGAVGNGMLGGTTTRVLHSAGCDVLVARCAPGKGPIVAGVDGSSEALKAVAKAVTLGGAMDKSVHLTAVYDPDFHTHVFGTMAETLSSESQDQIGLANQEKLHDDIINDGLGKLYADFLSEARERCSNNGDTIETHLVTGKAYCALDSQAAQSGSDLIVVSRYGHHRQQFSRLGSNAEGLIRATSANVLLVGGVEDSDRKLEIKEHKVHIDTTGKALEWEAEALVCLERVPIFVRSIAKRAVEKSVLKLGKECVCADDFEKVATRFGMGSGDNKK
jgi:nucleotide-binding universal stress UspA family protein